jgi:serine/threonine-protein kinase HipA
VNPAAIVWVELDGNTRRVGELFVHGKPGREPDRASFRYDEQWTKSPDAFALAPALPRGAGPHYTRAGRSLFGALSDSAPDRWGQTLMRRTERQRATDAGETPRTLRDIDFLLRVNDVARQGALRFQALEDGPFVAEGAHAAVPPLLALPQLLGAADRLQDERESAADLQLLFAPGSSLGGARPKASVVDRDGALSIAKFSRKDRDEYRVVVWEAVALSLAARAGIRVPAFRVETIDGRDVLLVRRFDRDGTRRIPYLSAMSLLDADVADVHSYVEIAEAIRRHGAAATYDLRELWSRIVFTVMVNNTDDHLRNHGFVLDGTHGWRLSMAFDVNPVPTDIAGRELTTAIAEDLDRAASVERAMEVADQFGLSRSAAAEIVAHVASVVGAWRDTARAFGLSKSEVERMASAFEHP